MKRNRQTFVKISRGFTLIELIVSIGVLSLLMLATSFIFTSSFASYKANRQLENSIADAQFIMNLVAKELRTSTVVAHSTSSVQFFEYSKSQCIQYRFSGGNLEVARTSTATQAVCNSTTLSGFTPLGLSSVTGSFAVTRSAPASPGPQVMGKVTMVVVVNGIALQTTTSLRDYGYAGLQ